MVAAVARSGSHEGATLSPGSGTTGVLLAEPRAKNKIVNSTTPKAMAAINMRSSFAQAPNRGEPTVEGWTAS
jgi:hypothetical protein